MDRRLTTVVGEVNVLEVALDAGEFTITEGDAASLGLGAGTSACQTVNATTVTCPATDVTRVVMRGGPDDDQLFSRSRPIRST